MKTFHLSGPSRRPRTFDDVTVNRDEGVIVISAARENGDSQDIPLTDEQAADVLSALRFVIGEKRQCDACGKAFETRSGLEFCSRECAAEHASRTDI